MNRRIAKIFFVVTIFVVPFVVALATSFTFSQNSWLSGFSAGTSIHPDNQSGWSVFATSTNIVAGTNLQLATSSGALTITNDGSTNTGFNLAGHATSSTTVTGTGSSASVILESVNGGVQTTSVNTSASSTLPYEIKIGSDGYPRILTDKFIKCLGADCASTNTSSITPSGVMALNASDIPSFAFQSSYSLKYSSCADSTCSSFARQNAVMLYGYSGQYSGASAGIAPAIVMSTSGTAVMSSGFISSGWGLDSITTLYLTTFTTASTSNVVSTYNYGEMGTPPTTEGPSLVKLGADGFPRIAYGHLHTTLRFAKCANLACSSVTTNQIDTSAQTLRPVALRMGGDGFARIVDTANNVLSKILTCTNADCSGYTSTSFVTMSPAITSTNEVALGSDYFLRRVYDSGSAIYYQACTNATCSASSTTLVAQDYASPHGTAQYNNPILALGSDDTAFIAYRLLIPGETEYVYQECWDDEYQQYYDCSYYNQISPDEYALKLSRIAGVTTYPSSGTFTSGPVAVGTTSSWGALSWTHTGGQTITLKARSDADGDFSNATAWGSCSNITSGTLLSTGGCVTNGHSYLQYQASLSTADTSATPSLDDITVGYAAYAPSGSLISSAYDTADADNLLHGLSWSEDAALPSGTGVTVSLRTAATEEDLSNASWSDFSNASSDCTKVGSAVTCSEAAIPAGMKDGVGDRWFQYKVTLSSDGGATPSVDDVSVTYNDNPPTTGGIIITKTIVNDDGGTASTSDFTFFFDGGAIDLDTDTVTATGTYQVTETGADGYTATFGGDCDESGFVTITAGATSTCSIVNDDVEPTTATITVTKVVVNDDGGTSAAGDFTLLLDEMEIQSGVATTTGPGTFTVTETGPQGYTGTFTGDCDAGGSIIAVAENAYTCTLTNDDDEPIEEPPEEAPDEIEEPQGENDQIVARRRVVKPVFEPRDADTPTREELLQTLATLLEQLLTEGGSVPDALIELIREQKEGSPYTRDLQEGDTGADVQLLQEKLIALALGPAAEALAAHGTTGYFGPLTKAALAEYQEKNNIAPAAGYFGPITRAFFEGR